MNKLELNDKLASLYPEIARLLEDAKSELSYIYYIVDDSKIMFELALANDIWIQPFNNLGFIYAHARRVVIFDKIFYKDHESPLAASLYAIAMALVKLAESK